MTITRAEKVEFLKSKGWYDYYNPDYWCNSKFGSASVDCTNRGMSLEDAYKFETDKEFMHDKMRELNLRDLLFRIVNL